MSIESEFKLYVWDDPYEVAYGSSLCVVVARTLEEAKEIARHSTNGRYPHKGQLYLEFDVGEPTRVMPLPCGEWHEWSE
jgi:hypothetical protein